MPLLGACSLNLRKGIPKDIYRYTTHLSLYGTVGLVREKIYTGYTVRAAAIEGG